MTYSQLALIAAIRALHDRTQDLLDCAKAHRADAIVAAPGFAGKYFALARGAEALAQETDTCARLVEKMCELHKCSRCIAEAKRTK